jgi:hypothetical protein
MKSPPDFSVTQIISESINRGQGTLTPVMSSDTEMVPVEALMPASKVSWIRLRISPPSVTEESSEVGKFTLVGSGDICGIILLDKVSDYIRQEMNNEVQLQVL